MTGPPSPPAPALGPLPRRGGFGTALYVVGVALLALTIAGAGLQLATTRPSILPFFLVAVIALGALALRPAWIVPCFAALTWTAVGQSFFGPISPVETGGLILLGFAAYNAFSRPRVALDALLFTALLGLPLAVAGLLAGNGLPIDSLKDLTFVLVLALGMSQVRDLERLTTALCVTGLILGAGAVYSVLVGPTSLFSLATDVAGDQAARAAGPFGEPNFFALSMAALVPIALHVAGRGGRYLVIGLATAVAIGGGVLATGSRAGLLAAVISLLAHAIITRERTSRLAALGTIAIAVIAAPLFATQASSSLQRSVGGRATENLIAVAMFTEHPVAGVGPGGYPTRYRDYSRRMGSDPRYRREPHSLPLQIAAEQGIAGIAGWIAAAILLIRLVVAHRVWELPVGLALILATGTYLLGSLSLHGSQLRLIYMLAGSLLALAWATDRAKPVRAR